MERIKKRHTRSERQRADREPAREKPEVDNVSLS